MKYSLLLFLFLCFTVVSQAQCYQPNVKEADKAFAAGNYKEAKSLYQKALKCPDFQKFNNGQTAKEGIKKCNKKIEQKERVLPMGILSPIGRVTHIDDTTMNTPKKQVSVVHDGSDLVFCIESVVFKMVFVDGGTFKMGAQSRFPQNSNYDPNAQNRDSPVHSVTLNDFYIGQTEVTQALWKVVMGKEPNESWSYRYGRGDNFPAYYISYYDVQHFISVLNDLTGCEFCLPTEAEWEFAARGGNHSQGFIYSGSNIIDSVAWYHDHNEIASWDGVNQKVHFKNDHFQTHPVAQKQPNELSLYDMTGNVDEWCSDWSDTNYYSNSPVMNPMGPDTGYYKIMRGGDFWSYDRHCRVSYRNGLPPAYKTSPGTGFRLVLRIYRKK